MDEEKIEVMKLVLEYKELKDILPSCFVDGEKNLEAMRYFQKAHSSISASKCSQTSLFKNPLVSIIVSNIESKSLGRQIARIIEVSRHQLWKANERQVAIMHNEENFWTTMPRKCRCNQMTAEDQATIGH